LSEAVKTAAASMNVPFRELRRAHGMAGMGAKPR
jgi:hypothetical protein